MTGVLQRLVGRAAGELSAGLRPRLPSRFESGIRETGFQEIHAEEPAPRAAAPPAQPDPDTRRATPPAESPATDPTPARLQPPAPRVHGPPPAARPRAAADDAPLPATPPAPLLSEAPAVRAVSPEPARAPPPAPARPVLAEATPRRPEHRDPPRTAPEPLLPPDPAPRFADTLTEALSGQRVPPTDVAKAAPEEAPAPEITIHIGRLDIRAEAPKPPRPPRRADQARSLPALSDYLRGGGS